MGGERRIQRKIIRKEKRGTEGMGREGGETNDPEPSLYENSGAKNIQSWFLIVHSEQHLTSTG